MTKKENLRAVLNGEKGNWVPCGINFYQWFECHKARGTLPQELQGKTYIEAMKMLDCDLFSRNIDGGFRVRNTAIEPRVIVTEQPLGKMTVTEFDTPYGTLRQIDQVQDDQYSGHVEEYPVKDWATDGKAAMYLLEQREIVWDEAVFTETYEAFGDDGIVNVPFGDTPLKRLHWEFGLVNTCYFLMDEPDAAQAYCDTHWQKLWPNFLRIADDPRVESVILMDNVDTPFYPPEFARKYWAPYVRQLAELMSSRGKFTWVHACGKLAGLQDVFAETGLTGLEGVAHAPLGDFPPERAKKTHARFIFNGGFSATEQRMKSDDEVRAFYRDYFQRAGRERFIFGSACNTAINTPWERIKLARDLCREWGGAS